MKTIAAQRIVWAYLRLLRPHEIANLQYRMDQGTRFARPKDKVKGNCA